jgi:hypothetical protein
MSSSIGFIIVAAIAGTVLLVVLLWKKLAAVRFALQKDDMQPTLRNTRKVDLIWDRYGNSDSVYIIVDELFGPLNHAVYSNRKNTLTFIKKTGEQIPLGFRQTRLNWNHALNSAERVVIVHVPIENGAAVRKPFSIPLVHQHAFVPTTKEDLSNLQLGERPLDLAETAQLMSFLQREISTPAGGEVKD